MRVFERKPKFDDKLNDLNPQPARLEDWLKGFEFIYTRNPKKGQFVGKSNEGDIYAVKHFDINGNRYITFFYTFNNQKVVFFDLRTSDGT